MMLEIIKEKKQVQNWTRLAANQDDNLSIQPDVYAKIVACCLMYPTSEIAGYGYYNANREMVYSTANVAIGSGSNVVTTDKQEFDAIMELVCNGYPTANVQWHTHPQFDNFFSAADNEHQNKTISLAQSVSEKGEMVFIVIGHEFNDWLARVVKWDGKNVSYIDLVPSLLDVPLTVSRGGGLFGFSFNNNTSYVFGNGSSSSSYKGHFLLPTSKPVHKDILSINKGPSSLTLQEGLLLVDEQGLIWEFDEKEITVPLSKARSVAELVWLPAFVQEKIVSQPNLSAEELYVCRLIIEDSDLDPNWLLYQGDNFLSAFVEGIVWLFSSPNLKRDTVTEFQNILLHITEEDLIYSTKKEKEVVSKHVLERFCDLAEIDLDKAQNDLALKEVGESFSEFTSRLSVSSLSVWRSLVHINPAYKSLPLLVGWGYIEDIIYLMADFYYRTTYRLQDFLKLIELSPISPVLPYMTPSPISWHTALSQHMFGLDILNLILDDDPARVYEPAPAELTDMAIIDFLLKEKDDVNK